MSSINPPDNLDQDHKFRNLLAKMAVALFLVAGLVYGSLYLLERGRRVADSLVDQNGNFKFQFVPKH